MVNWKDHGWPLGLLSAYLVLSVAMAIGPVNRSDWFLENMLVFVFLPVIVFAHARIRFSTTSAALLFVFFSLHTVGSHWSYSNVPLPWASWGFARNEYDRVVHLGFGLLLWMPIREFLQRSLGVGPRVAAAFASSIIMTGSALYEIVEWGAVAIVAPDLGNAFLGAQGDEFDSSKDMGMALVGMLVSVGVFAVAAMLRAGRARDRRSFPASSAPGRPPPR